MPTQDLSGTWRVWGSDGVYGPVHRLIAERADPDRYFDVPVPMELHAALRDLGVVGDPNLGLETLAQQWVGEHYWQYATTFTPSPDALTADGAWLVFDQVDLCAGIALNGERLETPMNAFCPFRVDLAGKLREGENELVVFVESGLYAVAEKPGRDYNPYLEGALNKRQHVRKPQYQFGWDWNARLINIGITGPVRLEWADAVRLDQTVVWSELAEDHTRARITVRAFVEGLRETAVAARMRVRIAETGVEAAADIDIESGLHCYSVALDLDQPELWWPVGHGGQPLYTAQVAIEPEGRPALTAARRFGVRRVRLCRKPHEVEGEYFILEVNDRPIFCKGGNWVPADMLYSTVTPERVRELVELAVTANFNLLRIWGGGEYAGHRLLDACDEAGLLVWHDFMFACVQYPGHEPAFLAEVRREVTWAVREFAYHPSLAVWCGNNEIESIFAWGAERDTKYLPDYALYHHVIPVILRAEDPVNRPYWPSSPYSPDHAWANDPTVGDQHPWDVTLGPYREDYWFYRQFVDRFPNEGGVLGATSPATLRQFLPKGERRQRSRAWEHHENAMNLGHAGLGVSYRAVRLWCGLDYHDLDFEAYVLASALLHAEGLVEYIANYRRRMFSSACAVFWMYNDSWPVTHGWSIVDYYRRRKLAYHPVRRAFAPATAVVAEEDGEFVVFGVNDTPEPVRAALRWGVFATRGWLPEDATREVKLPPNQAVRLAAVPRARLDQSGTRGHGVFATLERDGVTLAQHRVFVERFHDLDWAQPEVGVTRANGVATFSSDAFVWGATLDPDGEAPVPDDVFDLLPGVPYRVPWPDGAPEPRVAWCGNRLFVHA